jgi:hypothetical protein
MQAWEWALELRTELEEFWASPVGQRFGQGWSNVRTRKDMPPIQTIERVKLPVAAPFYVTAEMTDLLIHAAASFPETEFRPMDLPLEAGFVVFAKAIPTLDIHLKDVPWRAFSWGTTHDAIHNPVAHGVHLAFYDHRDERTNGAYAPEEGDIGLLDMLPTLGLNHETTWAFGSSHRSEQTGGTIFNKDTPIPEAALASGEQMMATVHAFWLLCWQRIGTPHSERASRGLRRRMERSFPGRPIPEVRVITLRRPKAQNGEVDPDQRGREYSHRWWVNGHWRKQWYPSEERHKPRYIEGYVKGPDDRPFQPKDDVYLWRR